MKKNQYLLNIHKQAKYCYRHLFLSAQHISWQPFEINNNYFIWRKTEIYRAKRTCPHSPHQWLSRPRLYHKLTKLSPAYFLPNILQVCLLPNIFQILLYHFPWGHSFPHEPLNYRKFLYSQLLLTLLLNFPVSNLSINKPKVHPKDVSNT